MTSSYNNKSSKPNFTRRLPTSEEKIQGINILLGFIEKSALAFPIYLSIFSNYEKNKFTTEEIFFDQEFSDCLQELINESEYSGFFKFHDESPNAKELLKSTKKKGTSKRVDIGIRLSGSRENILVIEGKRLANKYDKQYVSGNTGGICRFKREEHGKELNLACMVGYLQAENFKFWHDKINKWLQEERQKKSKMKWASSEELSTLKVKNTILGECSSIHDRVTLPLIELRHYWIKVV